MPSTDRWLLRGVTVDAARRDCRLAGGHIVELATGLPAADGEQVLDAGGGALLPGLIDHHTHVLALAAAQGSWDLRGADLSTVTPPAGDGWLRIIGLDKLVSPAELDAHVADRPVKAQHRSGAVWMLSSAAIERLGGQLSAEERRTGHVWRGDSRVRTPEDHLDGGALAELGSTLASWGLTHLTDATPGISADARALIADNLPQRVRFLGGDDAEMPYKIVVPDHETMPYERLLSAVRAARTRGRAVAVHAVTALSLALVIAVLREVGPRSGDRVEHAAVCDDRAADALAELGVTVVTQPTIPVARGSAMLSESDAADRPWLWRVRGLGERDVRVVLSSDAPYGDPNPWASLVAASTVGGPGGRPFGADEVIDADRALRSYLTSASDPAGPVRTVAVGAPADLCLLDATVPEMLARVRSGSAQVVRATFVGGERLR